MSGEWDYLNDNLIGRYENGLREGIWKQTNGNETVLYRYSADRLVTTDISNDPKEEKR